MGWADAYVIPPFRGTTHTARSFSRGVPTIVQGRPTETASRLTPLICGVLDRPGPQGRTGLSPEVWEIRPGCAVELLTRQHLNDDDDASLCRMDHHDFIIDIRFDSYAQSIRCIFPGRALPVKRLPKLKSNASD